MYKYKRLLWQKCVLNFAKQYNLVCTFENFILNLKSKIVVFFPFIFQTPKKAKMAKMQYWKGLHEKLNLKMP